MSPFPLTVRETAALIAAGRAIDRGQAPTDVVDPLYSVTLQQIEEKLKASKPDLNFVAMIDLAGATVGLAKAKGTLYVDEQAKHAASVGYGLAHSSLQMALESIEQMQVPADRR